MLEYIHGMGKEDIKKWFMSVLPWLIILLMAFNMYYQQIQFENFKNNIIAQTRMETADQFKDELNGLREELVNLQVEMKNYMGYYKEEIEETIKDNGDDKRLVEKYQFVMDRKNGLSKENIKVLEKYAKDDGMVDVNPNIVFAMQYVESRFNPNAENGKCYGLGQMSLSTANYVKDYYGYDDVLTIETLKDPNLNIKYHVSYLKLLYKTKNRNWYNVIMVYSGAKLADNPNDFMWGYISKMNDFLSVTKGTSFQKIISDKNFSVQLE